MSCAQIQNMYGPGGTSVVLDVNIITRNSCFLPTTHGAGSTKFVGLSEPNWRLRDQATLDSSTPIHVIWQDSTLLRLN